MILWGLLHVLGGTYDGAMSIILPLLPAVLFFLVGNILAIIGFFSKRTHIKQGSKWALVILYTPSVVSLIISFIVQAVWPEVYH